MQIPQKIRDLGLTDQEVIDLITEVAERIVPKYVFGYYDVEDLVQEAIIIGLKGLRKYDKDAGELENFMSIYLSSRMKNFKRNNYYRIGTKNAVDKIAIMNPVDISDVNPNEEDSMHSYSDLYDNLYYREMIDKINRELPVDFRRDYLKLMDGVNTMTQRRKNELIQKIREIVDGEEKR